MTPEQLALIAMRNAAVFIDQPGRREHSQGILPMLHRAIAAMEDKHGTPLARPVPHPHPYNRKEKGVAPKHVMDEA